MMYAAARGDDDGSQCWADNWESFNVFAALSTQWNIGPSSIIGLKYESIPVMLTGIKRARHGRIISDLRVMEIAALGIFNKS